MTTPQHDDDEFFFKSAEWEELYIHQSKNHGMTQILLLKNSTSVRFSLVFTAILVYYFERKV